MYDGARAMVPEWAALGPTDAFGRTKLSGEKAVASRWPRHAILRHSLVFGPPPPSPVEPAKLWLQSLDGQLKAGVRFRWSVQSICGAGLLGCWALQGQSNIGGGISGSHSLPG